MFKRSGYFGSDTNYIRPMKDLLIDQQKGRFLTRYEKELIQKEAEKTRKQRMHK